MWCVGGIWCLAVAEQCVLGHRLLSEKGWIKGFLITVSYCPGLDLIRSIFLTVGDAKETEVCAKVGNVQRCRVSPSKWRNQGQSVKGTPCSEAPSSYPVAGRIASLSDETARAERTAAKRTGRGSKCSARPQWRGYVNDGRRSISLLLHHWKRECDHRFCLSW